eukprot:4205410-Pyramimonas_sp.AAC.1
MFFLRPGGAGNGSPATCATAKVAPSVADLAALLRFFPGANVDVAHWAVAVAQVGQGARCSLAFVSRSSLRAP